MNLLSEADPQFRPRALTLLAAIALAAIFLRVNPFAGETLAPLDLLVSYEGWQTVEAQRAPIEPLRRQRSDVLDYVLPAWNEARGLLRQGRLPVWLHASGGGTPGIQLPLSGLFTPSFLLFAVATTPGWGLYLAALAKLVIAGIGMFWFLRLYTGPAGALLGSISFAACGFHTAYFFWPHVSTSIWLPWLFLCTAGFQRDHGAGWLFGLSAVTALMILGGFPAVAAYCLYAWLLFVLWLAGAEFLARRAAAPALRLTLRLGLAVLAGFAMCAYSLYEIHLYLNPIDLDYRDRSGRSLLGFSELIYLLDPLRPDARGMPPLNAAVYPGLAVVPLVALAMIFGWLRRLSIDRSLLAFLTLLGALGVLVCYGVLNGTALKRLPVFDRNPWHRALVVLDFALAALAALGLQGLLALIKRNSRAVATMVMAGSVALMVAHGFDLSRYFLSFNAIVPDRWYYPPTPALSHIQRHLGPGENAIADASFMVSGTLGAYGIPEWFAHRHRTESEKKLLRKLVSKPFVTPTAARFPGSRIRSESPAFRELGVRYLLTSRPLRLVDRDRPSHYLTIDSPAVRMRQAVWIEAPRILKGIRVELGDTAQTADRIALGIFDRNGRLRAGTARPAAGEPGVVVFEWPRDPLLRRGFQLFELELTGAEGSRLPLRRATDAARRLRIDERTVAGRLGLSLVSQWQKIKVSDSVHLYQLDADAHGPYLRPTKGPRRYLAPDAVVQEPGRIRAEFARPVSGEFVWTGRLDQRWRALVDGQATALGSRYEVLPTVPVKDARSIELRYPLAQVWAGLSVTVLGLLLCAFGAGFAGRSGR